ncbi:PH domain-containing protein [Actinacidiphila sp. ITFR-21]|uniref:PH domain-containing protein n=1 Tax=Actinacidiphila sp. ITFR-21 TaxID=3075199 RepID=UPI002888FCBC|nr:PH domain-containing protein [Streptomyces sp. ITFR-21]WNI17423.1 PH domain-containing protein [Streptomyces sp. ITFR-21]
MRSSNQERSGGTGTADGGQPGYADRVYRSAAGVIGGVLLLVVAGWLGGDAVVRGSGRTPWLAAAALLLVVPLVVAFTVRPAVYAGAERIRIRNPFRTVTLPWSAVDQVRSSYSTELFAADRKFQLWAIPVSIRARKRAVRQTNRARAAGDEPYGTQGLRRRPNRPSHPALGGSGGDTVLSWADQAVAELRELAGQHPATDDQPPAAPRVRWSYEVIVPAAVGAVALLVLLATGG